MAGPDLQDRRQKAPLRVRAKRAVAKLLTLVASFLVAGAIVEAVFRVEDWRASAQTFSHGEGGQWLRDNRWGWRLTQGHYEIGNPEFHTEGDVNTLSMNDDPFDPAADVARTRVLALGDSHTVAWGVSMRDAWPKVLERGLDAAHPGRPFRVYNAAVAGYNVHQYLLRLINQGPIVKPDYVVVGISYATDLSDLIPITATATGPTAGSISRATTSISTPEASSRSGTGRPAPRRGPRPPPTTARGASACSWSTCPRSSTSSAPTSRSRSAAAFGSAGTTSGRASSPWSRSR